MTSTEFRGELEARLKAASKRPLINVTVFPDFDQPIGLTGAEILSESRKLASRFCASDREEVVLLLLPHSAELFLLHIGLILLDRYPAILPWPTRRVSRAKYQNNLAHQLQHLAAGQLITVPSLAANLRDVVPFQMSSCTTKTDDATQHQFPPDILIAPSSRDDGIAVPPGLDSDCLFFQFSGGTTGSQKSIAITASTLVEQLNSLSRALSFTPRDGVVSWLPLYHDMGLIACLWLPLWTGARSFHMAASDWLLNPGLLLRYLDKLKATFCWLPNFAFSYLAQRQTEMPERYSLQHVRAFINCSEPLRRKSMDIFCEAFERHGVRREALQGSYALAENVFAVTQTQLDSTFNDSGDQVLASSGKLLPGMNLRIKPSATRPRATGIAGEIQISTPSLFSGYFTKYGRSRSGFTEDGWYSTGDQGFLSGDELYVAGRIKDMLIAGGQNIFPEDVEYAVNRIRDVYPGRAVAFGVEDERYGTEALAVVAEMKGTFSEQKATALEAEIREAVLATIGIAPRHVAVVPARWIVKSTAGKICRRETKERFLERLLITSAEQQLA